MHSRVPDTAQIFYSVLLYDDEDNDDDDVVVSVVYRRGNGAVKISKLLAAATVALKL